jgi:hypothetical protein
MLPDSVHQSSQLRPFGPIADRNPLKTLVPTLTDTLSELC